MRVFDSLDWATYAFFRFQANNLPPFLTRIMEAGDWLGSYIGVVAVLILASVLHLRHRSFAAVARLWIVFAAGVLLVEVVKLATRKPRRDDAA